MAITLSIDLGNGYTSSYWKISQVEFDQLKQQLSVQLISYKDLASRQANLNPLAQRSYILKGSDYLTVLNSTNILQALYDYVKVLPDFAGETDS